MVTWNTINNHNLKRLFILITTTIFQQKYESQFLENFRKELMYNTT